MHVQMFKFGGVHARTVHTIPVMCVCTLSEWPVHTVNTNHIIIFASPALIVQKSTRVMCMRYLFTIKFCIADLF